MAALTPTDVIKRSTCCVEADVDGEIIVLNHETGSGFALDPVATSIWVAIGEPSGIGEICATLLAQYEVDRATCEAQVIELLEGLRKEGMIELCEPGATKASSRVAA